MAQNIITAIGLFIGIWFTFVNVSRIFLKVKVPSINFIIMALGWTVFIAMMWVF